MNDYFEKITAFIRNEYATAKVAVTHTTPILHTEHVPMSDGKKMLTYYFLPDEGRLFPTILQRSAYPHVDGIYKLHGEELAKRGYAYVWQYCRGVGGSEGEWIPNENERQDGIDTLDWLCKKEWAGNIGYTGSSYLALTGWAFADCMPDKVKSLYLTHYGTDRYTSAYQNGLFRHDVLTSWAMGNAGFPITSDYLESCRYMPHNMVDESLWGRKINWYRDWVGNTRRTDPYWSQGFWAMLAEIPKKVTIPVYIGEGWYDHHLGSALKAYTHLSEEAKTHAVLSIGCWNHFFQPCLEGRTFSNLRNSDTLQMLDWFEKTLKNNKKPVGEVRTYLIHADEWKTWKNYPFDNGGSKRLYLTYAGKLTLKNCMIEHGMISYIYDPKNPVPSHGAESMLHTMQEVGSLLQPEPGTRSDVISFVSEPLEAPVEILGQIKVKLYVSTDAVDTAFTAKVMEVFPDGKVYNIRSSIAVISYQNELYQANDITSVVIETWDIHWKLNQGSRVRVDISSSDFPQYAVHSNRRGVWSEQTDTVTAKQTVYFGGNYDSHIELPLAP